MIKGLSLIYTEEDIQKAYKQGIENGKYEAKSEFEVYKIAFNSTVEGYKKCISELKGEKKELLRKEFNKGFEKGSDYVRDFIKQEKEIQNNREEEIQKLAFNDGYQAGKKEGYEDCSEELHSQMAERELEFTKKFYNGGYDHEHTEQYNPNKETQEFMQEVLDRELALVEKYPHYYKDIRHLNIIDIYRFLSLFGVTDPCLQHAAKKMCVSGKRGSKDYKKDIKEAMDTLNRWEYMQEENERIDE